VEKAMLNQLREVYDHTGKLKQMLLDMDTVKELDSRFEKWQIIHGSGLERVKLGDDGPVFTSSFKVFSAANWPLKPPNTNFILPSVISRAHDEFNDFYRDEHPGRKLLWHWQLCQGEMRINLKKGPAKGYILHASAYQIAILLLFNEKDELSYEDIKASTELETEILDTLLSVFLKAKLLKCEERDSAKLYTVNDSFASKKVKIDIRVSFKKQKNVEMGETHRKIKEERKLLMQVSTLNSKESWQVLIMETGNYCAYYEVTKKLDLSTACS
jgi:cullin 1